MRRAFDHTACDALGAHGALGHTSGASRHALHGVAATRYCINFENTEQRDYVSEKVFQGLAAGCVPVYRGSDTIARLMPTPNAVILATDFDGPKNLSRQAAAVGTWGGSRCCALAGVMRFDLAGSRRGQAADLRLVTHAPAPLLTC